MRNRVTPASMENSHTTSFSAMLNHSFNHTCATEVIIHGPVGHSTGMHKANAKAKFMTQALRFLRRWIWRRRTDVSEERITYIIRVTRISELGTTLAVTSNCSTLRRNTKFLQESHGNTSQKTAFFILNHRENLKPYINYTYLAGESHQTEILNKPIKQVKFGSLQILY
jgi:hypothetical protein